MAEDLQQKSIDLLQRRFGDAFSPGGEHAGQKWCYIRRDRVVEALTMLRDSGPYEMLVDLTCVDWLGKGTPERFCIVYNLYSVVNNHNFRVMSWVPEADPEIDTAVGVWKAANWAEREVWDLFGIRFRNHPDLRRLMLPFEYTGHPLRKDYPLIGHGERQNFPRFQKD